MRTTTASARPRITILVAGVALLLVGAPAVAMSTASASLGPLGITLYDLNPDDGIAPSISFYDDLPYGSYVTASAEDGFNGQVSSVGANGTGRWAPVAVATSGVVNAWANSSVSGTGGALGTVLAASGTALGTDKPDPFDPVNSQFGGSASAPNGMFLAFTLSASTAVDFSAAFDASASVTQWWDPATSFAYEYAFARGQLLVFDGRSGSGEIVDVVAETQNYYTDPPCPSMTSGYCRGPGSASVSRSLVASLVNDTGAPMDGHMENYVQVFGYSAAAAVVPEPATGALALAGLAAVAFATTRRTQRSACNGGR